MKIRDLERICQKSGADMRQFSFFPKDPMLCEVMFCIHPGGDGYEAFILERYEKIWSGGVHSEERACLILLAEIKKGLPWYKFEE